jgi:hypothetical protein
MPICVKAVDSLKKFTQLKRGTGEYSMRDRFKEKPWESYWDRAWCRCNLKGAKYKENNIKFSITKEDVKKAWFEYIAVNMVKPSIDRIKGALGYVPGNIRFVEYKDNVRKTFGRWAVNYDCCVKCNTKEIAHNAKGLCKKCYFINRRLAK